ncbi:MULTISPECIES: hypothetical protein [Methanocorpusculum]|jgi:hypothetical protein|uniref:HEAT repeat domain-containing protein n=1 Tax=Methanocorpusculum parvum TaxID=2193 RepID=A0AAX0Q6C4_9EURY|nr:MULTISPECIES: hypothetical protein [Methanocorpusculum]MDD2248312.1 hypothetical protein [Methanocorpusculum sp.]MDD2802744.1 hypothetical protein [Methanocorpusculum sp.]MDD3046999.1 hypothetical protein [Methanocorpusculum sp.]MDD3911980.1 hypothetical protein [Methanocorpusculum sp.]MDD4423643.1 hypothetical protein [Methanocorpusculum parvum]
MAYTSNSELDSLADELYEASGDDDFVLAELLRGLPKETAVRLCTSDLTNALQTYLYAFEEEPAVEIYERLLLQPSSQILRGIKIGNAELAELIFGFDKNSSLFFIAVWNGEKFLKAFSGPGAYREAVKCAKEQCA